jgi:rhodanese-related sulfurtransferase
MKIRTPLLAVLLSLSASVATVALAQQAAPAPATGAIAPQPWIYKTKQLNRSEIDALLAKPAQLLVIDVRRPDELTAKGSFPVYLNIQVSELEKSLDYIPKDRAIVTVSNRAHRAGAAGDLLTAKGFNVAGAAGSQDYEDQGGKITKVAVPAPRPATATTAAPTVQAAK